MNRSRWMAKIGRIGTRAALGVMAVGLFISVPGIVGLVTPAVAAAAGPVEIVGANNAAVATGNSTTPFRFKLPTGAACTGDTSNKNYFIQSFLVPESTNLDSLRFDSSGPEPVGTEYRQPMIQADGPDTGNPFVSVPTAMAVPAGGPGPIIQPLPAFSFGEFPPGNLVPGTYSVGIACTLGPPSSATQLDKYWRARMTLATDPADPGQAKIKFTVAAAVASTTTTLAVTPATSAGSGTEVTMTATVVPGTAAGSVTFNDGTTSLGAPVAVSGGSAVLKRSDLASGPHSLTASFTPTSADAFAPSASSAVTYTITAGGTGTSTTSTSTSSSSTSSTSSSSSSSSTSSTTAAGSSGSGTGSSGSATGGTGSSSGSTSGTAATGKLPKSGSSLLVPLIWAFLLLCLGRAAILVGRRPPEYVTER